MPQPDPACPLTEFYLLAQQALEKSGSFMLPALLITSAVLVILNRREVKQA